MCGKFTQMYSWPEVHAFLSAFAETSVEPMVTVTPMRFAKVIVLNDRGEREAAPMRWGFVDKRAPASMRPKHMHARAETVDELPRFRHAFAKHRGILVVNTFNEGEELPNGKRKQWTIKPLSHAPIAIAVICEKIVSGDDEMWTFIQVTTPANKLISKVTDRMPAILPADTWPLYLGEDGATPAEAKSILETYEDDGAWSMAEEHKAPKTKSTKPPQQADLL